ncbi:MAG TPA: hypothetical protein VHO07_00920 [Streptosporangiaceae bacterium]|nr:hypothetical protein [Streptosporangiaceae bacterium]
MPGEDIGLSSTLLTRIGELVTNGVDSTAVDDAALLSRAVVAALP